MEKAEENKTRPATFEKRERSPAALLRWELWMGCSKYALL